jgi:hypothetical protein
MENLAVLELSCAVKQKGEAALSPLDVGHIKGKTHETMDW